MRLAVGIRYLGDQTVVAPSVANATVLKSRQSVSILRLNCGSLIDALSCVVPLLARENVARD